MPHIDNPSVPKILLAASTGDKRLVTELLSLGHSISSTDDNGRTALHYASSENHSDLIPLLLSPKYSKSADPDPQDNSGITPLHIACRDGHIQTVKALANAGCDLNVRDNRGFSPLHFACSGPELSLPVLDFLIDNIYINVREAVGNTPLHLAVSQSNINLVTHLLAQGASPNEVNHDGRSPLHLASEIDEPKIVELIVSCDLTNLYLPTKTGETCLHVAAQKGNLDNVRVILDCQSDGKTDSKSLLVNTINELDGFLAIHYAVEKGFIKVTGLLLKYAQSTIKNARDKELKTPLHHAVINEHINLIDLLIDSGADVKSLDDQKKTPIHWSTSFNFHHVSKLFLKVNQSQLVILDFQDSSGNTPVHYLALNNDEELIKKFFKLYSFNCSLKNEEDLSVLDITAKNANLSLLSFLIENATSSDQKSQDSSALMHAARSGSDDCVLKLLKAGYSPNFFNNEGFTPLLIALKCKFSNIVSLLLSFKVNVNVKDPDQLTPLHYAISSGQGVVVNKLLVHGAALNGKEAVDGDLTSPLHLAIKVRHDGIVQTLLQSKASTLARDSFGNTPLHLACSNGYSEAVPWIVQFGNKELINSKNNRGEFPLFLACKEGFIGIVEYLTNSNADCLLKNMDGLTAGFVAVLNGRNQVLSYLIKHELIDVNDKYLTGLNQESNYQSFEVNSGLVKGDTLLHAAIRQGFVETVQALIDHKADLCSTNRRGSTPLHVAVELKKYELIRLLLCNGANQFVVDKDHDIPLTIATKMSDLDAMDLLLESSVKPPKKYLLKALQLATINNDEKAASVLFLSGIQSDDDLHMSKDPLRERIRNKGQKDQNFDENDVSPLHIACKFGLDKIVVNLLSIFGADPNSIDSDGNSPLHLISLSGNYSLALEVLKRGGNLNLQDGKGKTPLMIAVENNHFDYCLTIINESEPLINVDIRDEEGNTLLHYIAIYGNDQLCVKLLSMGAYANAQNDKKRTPVHLACSRGNGSIFHLLIRNSGDFLQKCENGVSGVHFAAQKGHSNIIKLMVQFNKELLSADHFGNTSLMYAAQSNAKSFGMILGVVESLDQVISTNKQKMNILHFAASGNDSEVVDLILAKLDEFNKVLKTNIKARMPELIQFINNKDAFGFTPLQIAASKGNDLILSRLASSPNIDINSQSKRSGKVTALHLTFNDSLLTNKDSEARFFNCRKILLNAGAKLNLVDAEGNSVLHYAAERKDFRSAFLFISYGADPTVQNKFEKSPFMLLSPSIIEKFLPRWREDFTEKVTLRTFVDQSNIVPASSPIELLHRSCTGNVVDRDEDGIEELLLSEPVTSFNSLFQQLSALYCVMLNCLKEKKTPQSGSFFASRLYDKPTIGFPLVVLDNYVPFSNGDDVTKIKKNTFTVSHISVKNVGDGEATIKFVLPPVNSSFLLEVDPLVCVIKPRSSTDVRFSLKMRQLGKLRDVIYLDVSGGMRIMMPIRIDCLIDS
ncbi:hypothetical protein P9112_006627 [Eukaryota sp. TZLM1-RC]